MDTPQKHCGKCGCWKPATSEYFHKDNGKNDGFSSWCKQCVIANVRRNTNENKDHINARRREIRKIDPERFRRRENAYHKANSEKRNEKSRAWRNNNLEYARAKTREYHRSHRDTLLEKKREYYYAHRDDQIAKSREWRQRNLEYARDKCREYNKKWRAKNKHKLRIYARRYRSRKQQSPDTMTTAEWERCLEYFGHRCAVCDRPPGLWHTLSVDHWFVPVKRHGGTTVDNIIPLCHGQNGCNNSKHDKDPQEWLVERYGKRKTKQILERITAYFEWVKNQ